MKKLLLSLDMFLRLGIIYADALDIDNDDLLSHRSISQTTQNCLVVFNNITGLIGNLQNSAQNHGLTPQEFAALEGWFRLYKELDCAECFFTGPFSGTCCNSIICCNETDECVRHSGC